MFLDNVNWLSPVNRQHPLNRGLQSWYLASQGNPGWRSRDWIDLADPIYGNVGALTTLNPSTAWSTDTLDFNGSGYVNHGNVFDFERTDSFTISTSFSITTASPSTAMAIYGKGAAGPYVGYEFLVRGDLANDPVEFELRGASTAMTKRSNQTWVAGELAFFTWTYDGSSSAAGSLLYRGSDLQADSTTGDNLTQTIVDTGNFTLGEFAGLTRLTGSINSFRIQIGHAMSAAEVRQLHEQHLMGYPDLINRVPVWHYSRRAPSLPLIGAGF